MALSVIWWRCTKSVAIGVKRKLTGRQNPANSVENGPKGDTQRGIGSGKAVVPTGSPMRSTLHLRRFGALEQSSAKFLMRGRTIF